MSPREQVFKPIEIAIDEPKRDTAQNMMLDQRSRQSSISRIDKISSQPRSYNSFRNVLEQNRDTASNAIVNIASRQMPISSGLTSEAQAIVDADLKDVKEDSKDLDDKLEKDIMEILGS